MQCANILMYGKEIPHDFKEARRLLTLALAGEENFTSKEKGQLYAFMADSYLLSDGVTQLRQPWKKDDIETAVGWLRKAIQCGNSSAQYVLNKLIDEGLY